MENLRAKIINTVSKPEKRWRIFRIQWEGTDRNGMVVSHELSFGAELKLADLWVGAFAKKSGFGFILWLCLVPCLPVRIHLKRTWGGLYCSQGYGRGGKRHDSGNTSLDCNRSRMACVGDYRAVRSNWHSGDGLVVQIPQRAVI